MLQLLLFDYVPALMHLGISVRDCYWNGQQANTGNKARQVLAGCLALLVAVDNRGASEYIRSLALTLLYWTPYHSALPAAAFVEESLEASLSRLARMLSGAYHADTVSDIGAVYASLGRASMRRHDLQKPGLSRVYVHQVGLRMSKLLDHIVNDTMPFVSTAKQNKVTGTRLWPDKLKAVCARVLVVSKDKEFYEDVLVRALALMVKAGSCSPWDQHLVASLQLGLGNLSAAKQKAKLAVPEYLKSFAHERRRGGATRRGKRKRDVHSASVAVSSGV
jgi:hypothetical protein